jgi:hypothetical protein
MPMLVFVPPSTWHKGQCRTHAYTHARTHTHTHTPLTHFVDCSYVPSPVTFLAWLPTTAGVSSSWTEVNVEVRVVWLVRCAMSDRLRKQVGQWWIAVVWGAPFLGCNLSDVQLQATYTAACPNQCSGQVGAWCVGVWVVVGVALCCGALCLALCWGMFGYWTCFVFLLTSICSGRGSALL